MSEIEDIDTISKNLLEMRLIKENADLRSEIERLKSRIQSASRILGDIYGGIVGTLEQNPNTGGSTFNDNPRRAKEWLEEE